MQKSSLALSQIFEPIRVDLEQVDHEFARHVQSQVELIPTIGKYIQTSGGKRIRPAVLLMASRLSGYQGDRDPDARHGESLCHGGGVHRGGARNTIIGTPPHPSR